MPLVAQHAPTAAEARAYRDAAEGQLAEVSVRAARAGWAANFITDDTEALSADAPARP